MSSSTKVCTKCNKERAEGEYSPDNRTVDGLQSWCKPCGAAYQRERRRGREKERRELRREQYKKIGHILVEKHRQYRHSNPERYIRVALIKRCTDPKHISYSRYGGRGITVCERWRNSFDAFIEDVGPRPSSKHTIERVDNNGNYEPGNCRWATQKEQMRNMRRNRLVTARGKTQCIAAWSDEVGLSEACIRGRLNMGWSDGDAVNLPLQRKRRVA